ncbi:hypothetical protein FRB95_006917 [Tulasnella sp. JGI-2019a]|nr:hypothetical protein FRB95_006917 [Tulasnella sp. JGI-2019a]
MPSTLNPTPIKSIPIVTVTNETKDVVDTFITEDFKDTLFEVKYDSFIEAYLGTSALVADDSSTPVTFSEVAKRCLGTLEAAAMEERDPQPVLNPNLRHLRSKSRPAHQLAVVHPNILSQQWSYG